MYKITIRCKKSYYSDLFLELKDIFYNIKLNFTEEEAYIDIFENLLDEEKLRRVDQILDFYEKTFSTDIFIEIRDLDAGEPILERDGFKIGSIEIEYFSLSKKKNFNNFDKSVVTIKADYGFGNGQHPTTYICIDMMQRLLKRKNLKKALDFGCGTGILGIIAAKIFNMKVLSVDIDPLCVKITKENAVLNRVKDKIVAIHGSWDKVKDFFDLILANLTPAVIMESYQEIYHHLKDSGYTILAGLLESHYKEMKPKFVKIGFKVLEVQSNSGWLGVLLKK